MTNKGKVLVDIKLVTKIKKNSNTMIKQNNEQNNNQD